jgi:PASTA domain-containing protein
MNFSLPMLALLMANRLGDSSSDSGRAALLAMMIRPPMMGLLIAIMVAKQKANTTKAVISNSTAGKAPRPGAKMVNQIIPKADHSFFPTFIGLTQKEAAQQAKESGLSPTFIELPGASGKERVLGQDPIPGANWPRTVTEVKLFLG